jgi:hypothetical protein
MPQVRVGVRRVYLAIGATLAGRECLWFSSRSSPTRVIEVYIGHSPRYGHWVYNGSRYHTENSPATMHFESKPTLEPTAETPGFTEVIVFEEVEVTEDLYARWINKEAAANEAVLKLGQQHEPTLTGLADVVAGTLGLRVHTNLVKQHLYRQTIAQRGPLDSAQISAGRAIELIDQLHLPSDHLNHVAELLAGVAQASPDTVALASAVMGMLLQAWEDRDPISQFLKLFIALEVALSAVEVPPKADIVKGIREISGLIAGSLTADRAELDRVLSEVHSRYRPALMERFESLAASSNHTGWEMDVAAFRKFNKQRNGLMHRGEQRALLSVHVTGAEVALLEDIVERYVSQLFFKNMDVYQTKWRSRGSGSAQAGGGAAQ